MFLYYVQDYYFLYKCFNLKLKNVKTIILPSTFTDSIVLNCLLRKLICAIRSRLICRLLKKHYLVKDIYFSITQDKYPFLLTCFYIFDDDLSRFVHILSLCQEARTFNISYSYSILK